MTRVLFCPLSLGERVGVRETAFDPSLACSDRPSPLTPPPRGEGNKSCNFWSTPCP